MIRFILKTIEEKPHFRTVDVKNNDFASLNDILIGAKYEIIGIEHFITGNEVICGNMRINENGISFDTEPDPKFPEQYTRIIARDSDIENWIGTIFYKINDGQFEGGEAYYHQIAPLAGNENLIDKFDNPPFWWIVKDGKPHLVYNNPKF